MLKMYVNYLTYSNSKRVVAVSVSSKSLHPVIRKRSLAEHCLHLHQHDLKAFVDKKIGDRKDKCLGESQCFLNIGGNETSLKCDHKQV